MIPCVFDQFARQVCRVAIVDRSESANNPSCSLAQEPLRETASKGYAICVWLISQRRNHLKSTGMTRVQEYYRAGAAEEFEWGIQVFDCEPLGLIGQGSEC